MMEAGRVKHHLANSLGDPRNTVLAVGYCAPRTLGARLLNGEKEVSIHGYPHTVRAEIKRIDSFSGHGDYLEMAEFLMCQDPKQIKQTFLVHGDGEAQSKYRVYLMEKGFQNISIPEREEEFNF